MPSQTPPPPDEWGRPQPDEYAAYHGRYVSLVPDGNILITLAAQAEVLLTLFRGVADEDASRPQAPYLWSLKEAFCHVIDTERVFAYRALRFARRDPTPLPSFDQDDFVAQSGANHRPLAELLGEFLAVRGATLAFLRGLDAAAWDRRGNASGSSITVRAAAYIIAGHASHHAEIFRGRIEALRGPAG